MTLELEAIPDFISPPSRCTPSRIIGERVVSEVIRTVGRTQEIRTVLDIGCGGGEYRFFFPGCVYTCIDIVDHRYSEKKDGQHGFLIATASHLPVEGNSQDLVFSTYAFEYFSHPDKVLAEIHRVLRPGGVAIICLPTKWVKSYEVLSDLLRWGGISLGQVSAQSGIQYYSPTTLKTLARGQNLVTRGVISVYGWPLLLLKSLSSWCRVLLHLASRGANKLTRHRVQFSFPLYVSRKVNQARNREELDGLLKMEESHFNLISRLYLKLVNLTCSLDSRLGKRPVVEYVMLMAKPGRKGP